MWPEPADACPRVTSDWPQAVAIPDSELPFFPFPLARYEAEMKRQEFARKAALRPILRKSAILEKRPITPAKRN